MHNTKKYKSLLTQKVTDFQKTGELIFQKSSTILIQAQMDSGATGASLQGTRYGGFCYPRDHAYATRAFLTLHDSQRALLALKYILSCEIDPYDIMYQRYDAQGVNASYKPPQIDGNAQTLLSVTSFLDQTSQSLSDYLPRIKQLTQGILSQLHHFEHGSLVYAINGIIEYSPFEAGYDLYTNAVSYGAFTSLAKHKTFIGSEIAEEALYAAQRIKAGIHYYLYYEKGQTFIPCLRAEPDSSLVILPNLKSYLALSDFAVFSSDDPILRTGLLYHLDGTKNQELGGYNRYHELMSRHNFGNGPWPMVMLRLAQHYLKTKDTKKAEECFTWVLNAALNNLDMPYCLPEHISSKASFEDEYNIFKKINETSPRPAKEKEYVLMQKSKTMKQLGLAYAVNPLVWSHAQFIEAWRQLYPDTLSHNS